MNQQDELFREMERMAEDALRHFDRVHGRSRTWQPRADICETPESFLVTVELAGLPAEGINQQIEVTLTPDGSALIIRGRRDEPDGMRNRVRCHQLEIIYGPFERVIPLPKGLRIARENLTATYRDGLLLIELPWRSPEDPRTIPVGER